MAAIRRNYEYFGSLGIGTVLDQMITPYPGTEMRRELLDAGLVTNPYDYQWYNGCWPQVRTKHLTSKQLLFEKWKARRDIIEDWRANDQVKAHYPYFAGCTTASSGRSSGSTSTAWTGCTAWSAATSAR